MMILLWRMDKKDWGVCEEGSGLLFSGVDGSMRMCYAMLLGTCQPPGVFSRGIRQQHCIYCFGPKVS